VRANGHGPSAKGHGSNANGHGPNGRGNGASNGHREKLDGHRPAPEPITLGVVDYTLAKRALLRDFRGGLLSRLEICDAHPELIRAAKYLGAVSHRPCPVCRANDLRRVAYVYGDGLRRDNGRAFEVKEALAIAAEEHGRKAYVVEVCTGCSWNHLAEAFLARTAG
jgi:hypothetical protein